MAWDLNRVTLIGRLARDPELKYTPNNVAVVKFGLAVGGKPKPDGSDSVSFFDVVVWQKAAENLVKYCKKGSQVGVDGRLEQQTWTDKDGGKRSRVEITAERIEFLQQPKGAGQTQAQADSSDDGGDFTQDSFFNGNFASSDQWK